MQQLILWELSGSSDLMRSIHNTREMLMEPVIAETERHFANSPISFKAIAVLLLGGIYYANLHTSKNGSIICGMDVRSENGKAAILHAIQNIVGWAFDDF